MKNFNITRQLMVLLGAFGLTMSLAALAFFFLLRHSVTTSSNVATQTASNMSRSYKLLETLTSIHGQVQHFIRLKDPDEMEAALATLKKSQAETEKLLASSADLSHLKVKYDALASEENAVIQDVLRGGVSDAYERFFGTAAAQYQATLAALRQEQENTDKTTTSLLTSYRDNVHRSMLWQSAILGLALVALIAFGWRLKGRIVRELVDISSVLSDASAQFVNAANQVSTASQSLAEGSSEQAASLEETSASLEEMSSMTRRNSENAQKANELASQARAAADKGVGDMEALNQAMNAIKTSSADIAKIIKTIDEIAFQTNILALNAAVEAARAGEAGMGFAVVADEVRSLALRSADAAKETAAKIEGAISNTSKGASINQGVAQTLNEIAAKARQVDELVAAVAGASREQTQGITQINSAVGQMDKVTQNNAASAEESAAAAQELNAQAIQMKETVVQLRRLVGDSQKTSGKPGSGSVPERSQKPAAPATKPAATFRTNGKPHGEPVPATMANGHSEIPMDDDFKNF